jgi:hypothetical protein
MWVTTDAPDCGSVTPFVDVFLWFGRDLIATAHKHLIPNNIT